MSDIYMNILLSATGGPNVVSAIQSVTSALGGGGGAGGIGLVGALAGIGVVAAGAAVALGVTSVKAAADFQQSLTGLVTAAGETRENLGLVGDGLKQMAIDTATPLKDLTAGMFNVESASFHGADGLLVLRAAAEGAQVGHANLATATSALTTAMTDYHMPASQATAMMNAMNAASGSGKMELQDLASSMGAVLPIASSLGISFPQVGAAIATMTNAGVPAQQASENLAFAMRALAAPNKIAERSMHDVGLSAQELKDTLSNQGLAAAIQLIEDHVGKTFPAGSVEAVEAFKHIMGGATGYNVALMLGGKNMEAYQKNIDLVSKALNSGNKEIVGWNEVQKDLNFQWAKFLEIGETLLVTVGTKLLPIVTSFVTNALIPAATWISNLVSGTQPLSGGMSNIANIFSSEFGPSLQHIISLISGEYTNTFKFASDETKQFGEWYQSTLVPAIKEAEPPLMALAHTILDTVIPAMITIHGVVIDVVEHAFKVFGPIIGEIIPYVVKFEGVLADIYNKALKFITPYVVEAAKALGDFAKDVMDRDAPIIQHGIELIVNIVQFLYKTWMAVWPYLAPIVKGAWDMIVGIIQIAWALVSGIIKIGLDVLSGNWGRAWQDMKDMFGGIWQGVVNATNGYLASIKALFAPIGKWFSDRFTETKNGIMTAFGNIGKWFGDRWHDIQGVFATIGSWFHDRFLEAYNFITGVFKNIGKWFMDRWNEIVKGFEWLYNHNYYFKNLVDTINNIVKTGLAILHDAWQGALNWLHDRWQWLVDTAKSLWTNLSNTIHNLVNGAIALLKDAWTTATNWLHDRWQWLVGVATSTWTNVSNAVHDAWNACVEKVRDVWRVLSSIFSNAWNDWIAGPVGSFVKSLSDKIGGLKDFAYNWGRDMIQGFINGINGMVQNVKDAADNIMNNVSSILGFHSPAKEGPGRDLMTWGPGLIKGFSEGMESAIPVLKSSLNLVMQPVASTLSGQSLTPTTSYSTSRTATVSTGHTFIINISTMARSETEVKRLVDMVEEELGDRFRGQVAGYSSGSVF